MIDEQAKQVEGSEGPQEHQTAQESPAPSPLPVPVATAEFPAEQKNWAIFAHLSGFIGFVVPFGNVLGPLLIWLLQKGTMPLVDDQGKEALNFNISVTVYTIVLIALTFMTFGLGALVTIPLLLAMSIAWMVLTILAAVRASEGQVYRYPLTMRLVV